MRTPGDDAEPAMSTLNSYDVWLIIWEVLGATWRRKKEGTKRNTSPSTHHDPLQMDRRGRQDCKPQRGRSLDPKYQVVLFGDPRGCRGRKNRKRELSGVIERSRPEKARGLFKSEHNYIQSWRGDPDPLIPKSLPPK
ncbi:hypothetical protein CapIbe_018019 [Capra ibex]